MDVHVATGSYLLNDCLQADIHVTVDNVDAGETVEFESQAQTVEILALLRPWTIQEVEANLDTHDDAMMCDHTNIAVGDILLGTMSVFRYQLAGEAVPGGYVSPAAPRGDGFVMQGDRAPCYSFDEVCGGENISYCY